MSRLKSKRHQLGSAITLIPGDGIGKEITTAVVRILEAAGFRPKWETTLAGDAAMKVLREGKAVTPDLGGRGTTDEMCRAIIKYL